MTTDTYIFETSMVCIKKYRYQSMQNLLIVYSKEYKINILIDSMPDRELFYGNGKNHYIQRKNSIATQFLRI